MTDEQTHWCVKYVGNSQSTWPVRQPCILLWFKHAAEESVSDSCSVPDIGQTLWFFKFDGSHFALVNAGFIGFYYFGL